MVYCPKCGSHNHSVGACPSLSNKNFNAQQNERMKNASKGAASNAPGGGAGGGCLMAMLMMPLTLIKLAYTALKGHS